MQDNYNGKTVNERLYQSGRLEEFDKAVEAKNESQIRTILKDLEVDHPSIDAIVNKSIKSSDNYIYTTNKDIKPLPISIRYPIIAILSLLFVVGIVALLYDQKLIPMTGPILALATVPVILFVVRWWKLRGIDSLSKSILEDLQAYKKVLNYKKATYPAHVPQDLADGQPGRHIITFDQGLAHIESDIQLVEKQQYHSTTMALDNLIYLSTESWPAEKDIREILSNLARKNEALKKRIENYNRKSDQNNSKQENK